LCFFPANNTLAAEQGEEPLNHIMLEDRIGVKYEKYKTKLEELYDLDSRMKKNTFTDKAVS
jgi:hypothetical protein